MSFVVKKKFSFVLFDRQLSGLRAGFFELSPVCVCLSPVCLSVRFARYLLFFVLRLSFDLLVSASS